VFVQCSLILFSVFVFLSQHRFNERRGKDTLSVPCYAGVLYVCSMYVIFCFRVMCGNTLRAVVVPLYVRFVFFFLTFPQSLHRSISPFFFWLFIVQVLSLCTVVAFFADARLRLLESSHKTPLRESRSVVSLSLSSSAAFHTTELGRFLCLAVATQCKCIRTRVCVCLRIQCCHRNCILVTHGYTLMLMCRCLSTLCDILGSS
jgi:hypothetical protein